jgi:hypothetical protein
MCVRLHDLPGGRDPVADECPDLRGEQDGGQAAQDAGLAPAARHGEQRRPREAARRRRRERPGVLDRLRDRRRLAAAHQRAAASERELPAAGEQVALLFLGERPLRLGLDLVEGAGVEVFAERRGSGLAELVDVDVRRLFAGHRGRLRILRGSQR